MRTEIQPKNLHLPVHTADLQSQTHYSSQLLISPHSTQQCAENRAKVYQNLKLSRRFAFCLLTQASRDPLLWQVGSEEEHSYSVADEKASPLRPALPAMLATLKSHTTSWTAARCIPLHFVTLPWPILCQKWLALTVLWWIKELLQLWNRAEFSIHVKSLFLFWRNIFKAACNSPSVLFFLLL